MSIIEAIRKDQGLTRLGFAARAGVSAFTILLCERYNHRPRPETQRKLADALGREPGEIFPDLRAGAVVV